MKLIWTRRYHIEKSSQKRFARSPENFPNSWNFCKKRTKIFLGTRFNQLWESQQNFFALIFNRIIKIFFSGWNDCPIYSPRLVEFSFENVSLQVSVEVWAKSWSFFSKKKLSFKMLTGQKQIGEDQPKKFEEILEKNCN